MAIPNRWDLESVERSRRDVVEVARSVVAGELGIIAGCRRLAELGWFVVDDTRVDPDFAVFIGLKTETDHLPLEDLRWIYDPVAFDEKQLEVARFEDAWRDPVLAACRSVINRFEAG